MVTLTGSHLPVAEQASVQGGETNYSPFVELKKGSAGRIRGELFAEALKCQLVSTMILIGSYIYREK